MLTKLRKTCPHLNHRSEVRAGFLLVCWQVGE